MNDTLGIGSRIEHRTNRAGNRGVITVPATPSIHGAGVQARTATDATQRLTESSPARKAVRPLSTST